MHDRMTFGKNGDVPVGWIWMLESSKVKTKQIRAVHLMNKELIVFRDEDGMVNTLDAYCPHMGAHLVDGKVEGKGVRCFFHNWKFDQSGRCVDIPCLEKLPQKPIQVQSYLVREQYGLIWLWTGEAMPHEEIPAVPELYDQPYVYALGNRWRKNCHPNIVMINAIDEHHFATVHKLPGHILNMQPRIINRHNILFENQGELPTTHWFGRLLKRFYRGPITYNLSYHYGLTGTVTLGPDCLHLYLMFTLRECSSGTTIGKTIAFTKHRKGLFGKILNRMILTVTKVAGLYFAVGDTKVFQKIRFNLQNPIKKDQAVIAFIKHLEKQSKVNWLAGNHSKRVDTL